MKRRKTPLPKAREQSRLKAVLSIRERQLAACVAALKTIARFESAHQSIFATEVHVLQHIAAGALGRAHEIGGGKSVELHTSSPAAVVQAKLLLNALYGPFGPQATGAEDE